MKDFVRILPLKEGEPGQRLRVEREESEELLLLIEEKSLPEKVNDAKARNLRLIGRFVLDDDEGRWLRDTLIELYGAP